MAYTLNLGAAPHGEPRAEPGRTIGFAAINAFEVRIYRIAIVAFFGAPPPACIVTPGTTGVGRSSKQTLQLTISDMEDANARAYAETAAGGIDYWSDAALPPPVDYRRFLPVIPVRDDIELILMALIATSPGRPSTDRNPGAARIHANLANAYPEVARIARDTGGIPAS